MRLTSAKYLILLAALAAFSAPAAADLLFNLAAQDSNGAEPPNGGGDADKITFFLTRAGQGNNSVDVLLNTSGSATLGTDYSVNCTGLLHSCDIDGSTIVVTSSGTGGLTANLKVELIPTHDRFAEGTETVGITLVANGSQYTVGANHTLPSSNIIDNDGRGLVIVQNATETPDDGLGAVNTVTTSDGGTDTFTVALGSQPFNPEEAVTVTVTAGDTAEGEVSKNGTDFFDSVDLTFTEGDLGTWDDAQTITVRGKASGAFDNQNYSIGLTAAGADYDAVTGSVNVTNKHDAANNGVVQFVSAALRVREEGQTVDLVVERSAGSDGAVTVTYAIDNTGGDDDDAEAGDYDDNTSDCDGAAGDQLCWDDGDGEDEDQTISIDIEDDDLFEAVESFAVNLTATSGGAQLGSNAQVKVRILRDPDDNVTFVITAPAPVDEDATGNGNDDDQLVDVTVERTGGEIEAPVSVNYAFTDGTAVTGNPSDENPNGLNDYNAEGDADPLSGSLEFTVGESAPNRTKTVTVNIEADAIQEPQEFFTFALSGAVTGVEIPAAVQVVIQQSDTPDDVSVINAVQPGGNPYAEGDSVDVAVERTGVLDGIVSFSCAYVDGSAEYVGESDGDYELDTTTVYTWCDGEDHTTADKDFACAVGINDDSTEEGLENFYVRAVMAAIPEENGCPEEDEAAVDPEFPGFQAEIEIAANDSIGEVNIAPTSASDSEGETLIFTVSRTGIGLDPDIDVALDYVVEPTTNGNDGDAEEADYTDNTGTSGTCALQWAGGSTTPKQISVTLVADADALEPEETFVVRLVACDGGDLPEDYVDAPIGADDTSTVTILAAGTAPGRLTVSPATYSVVESAGSVVVYVVRQGGTDGYLEVDYATADGEAIAGGDAGVGEDDYDADSGTLHWNNGEGGSKPIEITINPDVVEESAETFTVSLDGDSIVSELGDVPGDVEVPILNGTATVTINDEAPEPGEVLVNDVVTTERDGTVTLKVTRAGSDEGAIDIDWETGDVGDTAVSGGNPAIGEDDYDAASGSLSWANGESDVKDVVITINDDDYDEDTEEFSVVFTVTIGDEDPFEIVGTVTINDEDGDTEVFTDEDMSVYESLVAEVAVKRTGNLDGFAQVSYTTVDGTAVSGSDYGAEAGFFTWNDGEGCAYVDNEEVCTPGSVKYVNVQTYLDDIYDQNESFSVELYGAIGPDGTADTIDVTDDETVITIFDPRPIPVLGQWMQWLLVALLALVGAGAMRRRAA